MNSTANGSSESSSCFTLLNSTAWKIGRTVTYCLFIIVSMAANSFIVMIVYKKPKLRKPINYFIANMASSDLLFPIFFTPWILSHLHTPSFLIGGGRLGQAFCKLVAFFGEVSIKVSIQNLVIIAVDRFRAVVFPLRPFVSLLHSCHVDSCRTYLFAILVRQRARWIPERNWCVTKWKKAFEESSSRTSLLLAYIILFTYIPVLLLAIFYSNIFIKLKTQAHPGEQSTNNQQQWNTRNSPLLSLQCLCSAGYLTLSTF